MIVHMFAFRWKIAASQSDKDRALREIRAFQGRIPGLIEVLIGVNFSAHSEGHALGGVMKFADQAALAAYNETDPVHRRLLDWIEPLVEAIQIDFEHEK